MDFEELKSSKCSPCEIGATPISDQQVNTFLQHLDGWAYNEKKWIEKTWKFKDFQKPLQLLNAIAFLAESIGHHPDFELSWGRLTVRLYTHKIQGLHLNDFIMANKIESLITVSL